MIKPLFFSALGTCLLLSGCAIKPEKYHWGHYEPLIYDMYVEPGSATPEVQIEKITADIEKAAAKGKPVPPGVYAHLGYMYALQGNVTASKTAFDQEKKMYPESKKMIDGMQKRAQQARRK